MHVNDLANKTVSTMMEQPKYIVAAFAIFLGIMLYFGESIIDVLTNPWTGVVAVVAAAASLFFWKVPSIRKSRRLYWVIALGTAGVLVFVFQTEMVSFVQGLFDRATFVALLSQPWLIAIGLLVFGSLWLWILEENRKYLYLVTAILAGILLFVFWTEMLDYVWTVLAVASSYVSFAILLFAGLTFLFGLLFWFSSKLAWGLLVPTLVVLIGYGCSNMHTSAPGADYFNAPYEGKFTLAPRETVPVRTSPGMKIIHWGGERYCVRSYDEDHAPAVFSIGTGRYAVDHGPDWYCLTESDIGKPFTFEKGRIVLAGPDSGSTIVKIKH